MRIDWEQGTNNWIDPGNGIWNIQGDYGAFHVYAFLMTMGILIAVGVSAFKFWKRGISLIDLAIGTAIIVPFSLFGASIFGKLNALGPGHHAGDLPWYKLGYFWEAGMSIHGGVYFGVAIGLLVFGIIGHYRKVSLYTYIDCIIPNILLGQATGRWGNFFNHEVMGAPLGLASDQPLKGISNFILRNTQMMYNGTETEIHGVPLIKGQVYQMSPIFLWEFIAFIIGWCLITWVVPNFGKWIGPKPWKRRPEEFEFKFWDSVGVMFQPWTWTRPYSEHNKSWVGIWNSAYYHKIDPTSVEAYNEIAMVIQASQGNLWQKKWRKDGVLNRANNPDGYWITKVGAEGGAYFFVWNFTRFFLELQRPDDHLFVMYEKNLSLALIMTTALIGVLFMVLTQTVIPHFFRQPGYLYEKQYFKAEPILLSKPKSKKAKVKKTKKGTKK